MIFRLIKRNKEPLLMKDKHIIGNILIGVFLTILILYEYYIILKTMPKDKMIFLIARKEAHDTMTILIIYLLLIWGVLIINYIIYNYLKKRYLSFTKMEDYGKAQPRP